MSSRRSTDPTTRGPRSRSSFPARVLSASFLSTVLALPVGAPASAQETELPTLAFPRTAELTLLAPVGDDGRLGGRLSYQRRLTLRASASASALLLPAELSNAVGGAVGGRYALDVGPVLVEPFAELGGVWIDARVEAGSYDVWSDGELRRVERYRAVTGFSPLVGGGVSVSAVLVRRLATRLDIGWWGGSTGGVDVGGLRVGLSLGMTGPDRRWYEHRTDRTPPRAVVAGRDTVDGFSIEVADAAGAGGAGMGAGPGLRVLAGDASGVREIRIDGDAVPLEPVDRSTARRLSLGEGAVVGSASLDVPPGGRIVPVTVVDSGGQLFRNRVHVVGPPDEAAPALEVLPQPVPDEPRPLVRVWATDAGGIAAARVGACPVRPVPSASDEDEPGWLIGGTAPGAASVVVTVRDQAGNAARVTAPVPPVPDAAEGLPPALGGLSAVAGRSTGGRHSIRVRGQVTDPQQREIVAVSVDGRPAALRERDGVTAFDGWLVADAVPETLTIEALTLDGRRVTGRVSTTTAPPPAGQLHALVVVPDSAAPGIAELRARIPEDRLMVVAGPELAARTVGAALVDLSRRVRDGDVALIHVAGVLMAPGLRLDGPTGIAPSDPDRRDPVLVYPTGALGLADLGHLVSAVRGSATLVSTTFRTTRGWGAVPLLAPGALPPPGCATADAERRAGVVDLGGAAPARVAEGLAGAADRDGDGRILAGELAAWLGSVPADGLLPFDPFAVVVEEVAP